MNFKYIGVDMNFVWLFFEIVVMGVKGVFEIIFCWEIMEVEDLEVMLLEKEKEYQEKFVYFYWVVSCGFIDEVIDLIYICCKLIKVFMMLENKVVKIFVKKYGNILF